MPEFKLPHGFLAAGAHVGIKNSKPDLAVLVSETPAVAAARVTRNRCRAACAERVARLTRTDARVRAIVCVSGNANALTGAQGVRDDEALAHAVAERLGGEDAEVWTASTGVIGRPMPIDIVLKGLPIVFDRVTKDARSFAEGIMTTDRTPKFVRKEVFIGGVKASVVGIAKGAGMIAPSLATMFGFFVTDLAVSKAALDRALDVAVKQSFNQLTVDNDMSTNDVVMALANGEAQNDEIHLQSSDYEAFLRALVFVATELAQKIALDGEGANHRLDVVVEGASSWDAAARLAKAVAGSMLVKSAIFGADPNAGGRILSAAGAEAANAELPFTPQHAQLAIQGVRIFSDGAFVPYDATQLRYLLREREIKVCLTLGLGEYTATAWGCDLSYDYVKINADYAAVTITEADGTVAVQDRLEELGPSIKKKTLIEALHYIDRFRGRRAVIKLGGAAMLNADLEAAFAEDILLLQSVGLRPILVHGGGPEISATLEKLGQETRFVDGLRVTDAKAMRVVEMVLTGSVNQRLVAALNREGAKAVGLSGKDGALIQARKMPGEPDLGQVGEVAQVNVRLLDILESDGYIPVISPIGLGPGGVAYNINADEVAAALAPAVGATKLIYLSDVPGLLEGDKVVSELTSDQLKAKLDRGEITGGMKPKLRSALQALAEGTSSVHLVDGRVPHNLIAELFTDRGVGTLIHRG